MYENANALFVIENSTLCGAKCIMCPRDKFRHKFETMPLELFKKAVDEIVALGVRRIAIGFFGEPLMDPQLKERLEYIKANYPNVELSMITTAYLLYGETLETVCDYIDIIKISNYGFTKETYEKVHGGNLKYESVKKNIDEFLVRHKRPYTIMTFLDLPENHEEMQVWKEYYEPKADRIDIWKPHIWGGDELVEDAPVKPCWRALNLTNLGVRTDGSVSVGCFDYNRELVIGNIKEDSLTEIVKGEKAQRIQRIHSTNEIMSSDLICRNCDKIRDRSDALIYSSGGIKLKALPPFVWVYNDSQVLKIRYRPL